MTYSLSLQDGSAYNPALITEDLASGVMELSWFTNDKLLVGDYPLRVTGGYETNTAFFDFTLHVLDPCITASRTIDSVTPYWQDVTYDILSPEYSFTWDNSGLTVNETFCGDWQYEFSFANSTVITASGTAIHADVTSTLF
jgi:hypothetical protein